MIHKIGIQDKHQSLIGRSVAVVEGSGAEFFLDRFLVYEGFNTADVVIEKELTPKEVHQAFLAQEVDAAIIWQPYVWMAHEKLGTEVEIVSAQSGQPVFWCLFAKRVFAENNPKIIESFLKGLTMAEVYLSEAPDEA